MIINVIGHGSGYEHGYEAEGEKWGINYFHPSLDVLFEIHPKDHPYHEKLRRERDNAKAADMQMITYDYYLPDIIEQEFHTDYLGSSTDYAIALAILRRKNEIHLWGVTMDDKGDHYEKRCATDFWCGVAIGRGIKVVVNGNSTVMTTSDGLTYGTFTPMKRRYTKNSD